MIDPWEGTVVCQRKAMSHISHNQCLEINGARAQGCDSCNNTNYILALRAREEQRLRERRESCRKLGSRRAL